MGNLEHLTSAERETISATIRAGRYSLLLGAGFSVSSRGGDGKPLPLAGALARALAEKFSLPMNYQLSALAEAVEPDALKSYFAERFSGCRASPGAQNLSTFVWKSIFTFNIDDVLRDVFSAESAFQKPVFLHFRDAFRRPEDPEDLQIVHLHGDVRRREDGYVFSTADYGTSISQESLWFKIAADELVETPFIVLGCGMEEVDLEFYLASRRGLPARSTQFAPSLFVTKKLDLVLEARCARFGLIPIESDCDTFLGELSAMTAPRARPIDLVLRDRNDLFRAMPEPRHERIFFRQWTRVVGDELPRSTEYHPLLEGVEPTWEHLAKGEIILRGDGRRIAEAALAWSASKTPLAMARILHAQSGDGKSAIAMRTAKDLSDAGVSVFFFSGRERLADVSAYEVLKRLRTPAVLFVDSASDHAFEIAELLRRCREGQSPCFVVCTERERRLKHLETALENESRETSAMSSLSGDEARALVRELRERGRLGFSVAKSDDEIARQLSRTQLLAALLSLVSVDGLERKIWDEYRSLPDAVRRVYACVALANHCGFDLRISVTARAAGIGPAAVVSAIMKDLVGSVFVVDATFLQTRHRVIADVLCSRLQKDEAFELCWSLASALAPYVTRQTIKAREIEALLSGRLLRGDFLEALIGERLLEFYEKVKPVWAWNSRFWEQYAIASIPTAPETALVYAKTAVGLEEHPHTLTTLAKVTFALAAERDYDADSGFRLVQEGIDAALLATELSRRWRRTEIHAYNVAIRQVSLFLEWASRSGILLKGWSGWEAMEAVVGGLTRRVQSRDTKELLSVWATARAHFSVR